MTFPHRVIAATDFSATSDRATDRAFELASSHGVPLDLLHVLDLDPLRLLHGLLGEDFPALHAELEAEAQRALRWRVSAPERPAVPRCVPHVLRGSVPSAVASVTGDGPLPLLVLGAQSGDLLQRAILGSTSSRVFEEHPGPVLVVQREATGPYRRVLVGIDLTVESARLIEDARAIAPDAELVLLHAFEVPFEGKLQAAGVSTETLRELRIAHRQQIESALRTLAASCLRSYAHVLTALTTGDPARCLLKRAAADDSELIVVARRRRTGAERLLLGSVTRRVLAATAADVLVVPPDVAPST